MATEKLRRSENPTPLAEGEFWRITGIGEATHKSLHSAGIDTFDQLASLGSEEIASILAGQVGVKERAARQDWTGQARQFAEALANEARRVEAVEPAERQHYEPFLVELLIEDESSIRRTRITQARGGEKASWAGWDSERLAAWIAARTNLPPELFSSPKPPSEPPATKKPAVHLTGKVLFSNIILSAKNSSLHKRFYEAGQPLELQFTLDLSETVIPADVLLAYQAVLDGRDVQTGRRVRLGEIQGTCEAASQIVLAIPIPGIEVGTYSLETAVQIFPDGDPRSPGEMGLRLLCDAGLVHIYARELEPAG